MERPRSLPLGPDDGIRPPALAGVLGVQQARLANHARLSFAKVAEYQARGLVHFHAIVRLDGPGGPGSPAPAAVGAAELSAVLRDVAKRARVSHPAVTGGEGALVFGWGKQVDVFAIGSRPTDLDLSDEQVAGYLAKYATKGAEAAGTIPSSLCCDQCDGSGRAGSGRSCPTCGGSGATRDLSQLPVRAHVRRMITTCWDLGADPVLAGLSLRRWAHMPASGGTSPPSPGSTPQP